MTMERNWKWIFKKFYFPSCILLSTPPFTRVTTLFVTLYTSCVERIIFLFDKTSNLAITMKTNLRTRVKSCWVLFMLPRVLTVRPESYEIIQAVSIRVCLRGGCDTTIPKIDPAKVCYTETKEEKILYKDAPHDRPCGVKQIFSNSPVEELTGDSALSSCSANCSL